MERTPYQENIIKSYYKNRDQIMWQKLAELATDLYLAEGKKRDQLWKRVIAAMNNLKIPEEKIQHIVQSDNPSLIAAMVQKEIQS